MRTEVALWLCLEASKQSRVMISGVCLELSTV
jgi:hypothetical protein